MIYNGHTIPNIGDKVFVVTNVYPDDGELHLIEGEVSLITVSNAVGDHTDSKDEFISFGGTIHAVIGGKDYPDSFFFTDGTFADTYKKGQELLSFFKENGFDGKSKDLLSLVMGGVTLNDGTRLNRRNLAKEMAPEVPHYEYLLRFTLIRQRLSEHEAWADEYQMPLTEEEYNQFACFTPDDLVALPIIKGKIQSFLASESGWRAICSASNDFNWGDAVQEGIIDDACGCVDGSVSTAHTIGATITVDQDELLAPDGVKVLFKAYKAGETTPFLTEEDVSLDMKDYGNLFSSAFNGMSTKVLSTIDWAEVVLPNGDCLKCDKDEEFQRLLSL